MGSIVRAGVGHLPAVTPESLLQQGLDSASQVDILVKLFMQMAEENNKTQETLGKLQSQLSRCENNLQQLASNFEGMRKREIERDLEAFRNSETGKKMLRLFPFVVIDVAIVPVTFVLCNPPALITAGIMTTLALFITCRLSLSEDIQIAFMLDIIRDHLTKNPNATLEEARNIAQEKNLERLAQIEADEYQRRRANPHYDPSDL